MNTKGILYPIGLLTTITGVLTCSTGWFGARCQYKCHCTGGNCWPSGECKDNVKCELGWFGPLCQYQDIARIKETLISVPSLRPDLTQDDNDATCTGNITVLSFNWTESIVFTWLRLTVKNPEHVSNVRLDFLSGQQLIPCKQHRVFPVSAGSSDIYCTVDSPVQQVNVYFDVAQEVCSIYISGGRNVALKQTTNFSSSLPEYNDINSVSVVDGDDRNCTAFSALNTSWSIINQHPIRVSRFISSVVYPFKTGVFILQSFTSDSKLHFKYTLSWSDLKNVFRVVPRSNLPVSRVIISVTNMTICEVEIFGELLCPEGYYGFDCNETCDCPVKCETTYNKSLGCPQCQMGFQGFLCDEPIPKVSSLWTHLVSFIVVGGLSFIILALAVVIVCLCCCRRGRSGRKTSLEQHRGEPKRNQYITTEPLSQCSDRDSQDSEPPGYLNVSEIIKKTRSTTKKMKETSDGYLQPQVIAQFKKCDSVKQSPVKGQSSKLTKVQACTTDDETVENLYEEICVNGKQ